MESERLHTSLLPSTKDVLGGHLHQKVYEALSISCTNLSTELGECSLVDKLTGMLLERSLSDIHIMLQDDTFLLDSLRCAINVLYKECPDLPQLLLVDQSKGRQKLSPEEVGEILFERINNIDEERAPQITGMLLELDVKTLLQLISNDDLFDSAVKKATEVLSSEKSPVFHNPVQHPSDNTVINGSDSENDHDLDADKESLGLHIHEEIMKFHPDCASNLTGMILELDRTSLEFLLKDKQQLEAAINKAYTEWTKQS